MNYSQKFSPILLSIIILTISLNCFGQYVLTETPNCSKTDYNLLVRQYTEYLKKNPNDAKAYYGRGEAYANLGKSDLAMNDFNRAIELNPLDDKSFYFRGLLYAERANYDKSIEEFDKAIKINPNDAYFYYNRARSYDFKAEIQLSYADASSAITINSKLSPAYYLSGSYAYRLGDIGKAVNDWQDVIKLTTDEIEKNQNDPCNSFNYMMRGLIHSVFNDHTKSLADFKKAIELEPEYSQPYYYRGIYFFNKKNFISAINDYTKAIEIDPFFAESYKKRAESYKKINELNKAGIDLLKFRELMELN